VLCSSRAGFSWALYDHEMGYLCIPGDRGSIDITLSPFLGAEEAYAVAVG